MGFLFTLFWFQPVQLVATIDPFGLLPAIKPTEEEEASGVYKRFW
jgi:hypothetical protein